MTKTLLIPVEGPAEVRELVGDDADQLQQLQAMVGGYIELVPHPTRDDIGAFVNENGDRLGLRRNVLASELLRLPIAGPAVFFGKRPPLLSEEMYDVPEHLIEALVPANRR